MTNGRLAKGSASRPKMAGASCFLKTRGLRSLSSATIRRKLETREVVGSALTGPNQSALESDGNSFGTAHRV